MPRKKKNKHGAVATNWNGEKVEVTFSLDANDFERLCNRAHEEFHKRGTFTIRLDMVDGEKVPVELRYRR